MRTRQASAMRSRQTLGTAAILAGLLAAGASAWANNLGVANTALRAPADGKVEVRFDISWENSWRDGVNWDAAWVFVKYSVDGGTMWSHAALAASGTNPAGFSGGTGVSLDVVVPADKKGAFIQRAGAGTGTVSNRDVTLSWDFATNGVSRSKSALVKVFAVEMVYIPEGNFYLGSTNGSEVGHFHDGSSSNTPFLVQTEGQISVSNQPGCLWGISSAGDSTIGPAGVLAPEYPKGHAAFYLMKAEISQRQYCDFLNTLTADQQFTRHDAGLHFKSYRDFIKKTGGSPAVFGCDANENAGPTTAVTNIACLNEADDGEWVACNYLSWADGCAYADWAALRPFTELEFEKACRGNLAPVTNEYAWGDANVELPYTTGLSNQNTALETPSNGNCNYADCSPDGPYRCGSYARGSSDRKNAGAGYYGNLDLSGGLWERPVTVGSATGRVFTGEHGDGNLTACGNSDTANWPGWTAGEVTGADGAGYRGGSWYNASAYARVSDRVNAANVLTTRSSAFGFRGARSAPSAP